MQTVEPEGTRADLAAALERERATRARLEVALAAAHMGTWEWDLTADRVHWSPQLEALHGFPPGGLGTHLDRYFAHIYPDDAERVREKVVAALTTGDLNIEYRALVTPGELRWYEARGRLEYDARGQAVALRGVCVDVSARKQAEQAQRWTEAILGGERRVLAMLARGLPLPRVLETLCQSVEELAGEGLLASILLLDADGQHLRHGAGPSLPAAYNAAIDGVTIGPSVGSCGTAAFRDEQVIVSDIATDPLWADFRALALRHDLRACWSTPIHATDGRVLGTFAMYYGHPRTPTPEHLLLTGLVGRTAAMVLERAQVDDLRARLAAIVDASHDAIIGKTVDGIITTWNPGAERLYGYTAAEIIGHPITDLVPPDRLAEYTRVMTQVCGGAHVPAYDTVRVHRDGAQVEVSLSLSPIADDAGNVTGVSAIARDIRPRRRLEAERDRLLATEREARAAAEAAIRARDEFVAIVSHDLRNPLAALRGQLGLLKRRARQVDALPARHVVERLDSMDATLQMLAAQVEELLDATRLQAGQPLELVRRPTDLADLAREAIRKQQLATDSHSLRFETAVPSLVGTWDQPRLERVVANLLSNAIKFSPRGGDVVVRAARVDGWAVLSVTDSGVGIPAADLPHLFERYRRASNVVGKIAGSGLGLAGARDIVQQHGGEITVQSVEGQGATFEVRLSLDPPSQAPPSGSAG